MRKSKVATKPKELTHTEWDVRVETVDGEVFEDKNAAKGGYIRFEHGVWVKTGDGTTLILPQHRIHSVEITERVETVELRASTS